MRLSRGRRSLSLAALLLALVLSMLWALVKYARPSDGSTITLPVAPGRTLHVITWSREQIFIDTEFNHSAIVNVSEALTIAFWYQNYRAGTAQRLLTLRLPSWPLLAATGFCASMALAFARWRRPTGQPIS